MTGTEDNNPPSRPISVAELLAKNGTIGSPPVGGRRRRRRGNSDSVSVAELTGEIPIIDSDSDSDSEPQAPPEREVEKTDMRAAERAVETEDDVASPAANGETTDAEAEYAKYVEYVRSAESVEFADYTEPSRDAPRRRYSASRGAVAAEQMSPDAVELAQAETEAGSETGAETETSPRTDKTAADDRDDDARPSYLRSTQGPLFGGGQSVADDLARREMTGDDALSAEAESAGADDDLERGIPGSGGSGSKFMRGLWIVAQSILAVAFGGGLFVAFDQLWKWNSLVALALSVLIILGLVAGVRVVRKTEDIASTLIAVAVGALVTFGPVALLLLQSN